MNHEFTVRPATLATLPDVHALLPDPRDRERRTADTRQRIEDGRLSPEQFLVLRTDRGVEGVALISHAPYVPVFPQVRPDTTDAALSGFLTELYARTPPGKTLVLQDDRFPRRAELAQAAGWQPDGAGAHVMYQTDLTARPYSQDPHITEYPHGTEWPQAVRDLMTRLGRADWESSEGWTLVSVPDDAGHPAGLAASGPGGRPGEISVNMLGVRPDQRGRGLGRRLEEHLFARALPAFTRHAGGTDASNHPMRRILEGLGSRLVATQLYFTRP